MQKIDGYIRRYNGCRIKQRKLIAQLMYGLYFLAQLLLLNRYSFGIVAPRTVADLTNAEYPAHTTDRLARLQIELC